jgi:hypothetical protein
VVNNREERLQGFSHDLDFAQESLEQFKDRTSGSWDIPRSRRESRKENALGTLDEQKWGDFALPDELLQEVISFESLLGRAGYKDNALDSPSSEGRDLHYVREDPSINPTSANQTALAPGEAGHPKSQL